MKSSSSREMKAAKSKATKEPAQERRRFTGQQKSEAVLSVWSERRKPSEVCRELQINYATLHSWQRQGLEAMIKVLEPKVKTEAEQGPALGPKLEKLLVQASQRVGKLTKLEKRLEKLQEQKDLKSN